MVDEVMDGVDVGLISTKFHNTVAEIIVNRVS